MFHVDYIEWENKLSSSVSPLKQMGQKHNTSDLSFALEKKVWTINDLISFSKAIKYKALPLIIHVHNTAKGIKVKDKIILPN